MQPRIWFLCVVLSVMVAVGRCDTPGAAGAATAVADAGPSHVLALDARTFDEKVTASASDEWLIKFYAPWCGHCQHFAPTYDKISRALHAVGKHVAKVDCTASKAVCTRFGISGYPTIKLVRGAGADRRVYDFGGDRSVDTIVKFVQSSYADASSDAFPKPGEAIETNTGISKLILSHPIVSGVVLFVVVVMLLVLIYVLIDGMRDEEEDAKERAKIKATELAANNGHSNGHSNGNGAANGNANGGSIIDSPTPKRRTQRAD